MWLGGKIPVQSLPMFLQLHATEHAVRGQSPRPVPLAWEVEAHPVDESEIVEGAPVARTESALVDPGVACQGDPYPPCVESHIARAYVGPLKGTVHSFDPSESHIGLSAEVQDHTGPSYAVVHRIGPLLEMAVQTDDHDLLEDPFHARHSIA